MNAMRKTDSVTGGIHLVRADVMRLDAAQDEQVAAAAGKPALYVTALAAERITAAVLLVMCIAAAVFV